MDDVSFLLSVALLSGLPVDFAPEVQTVRIWDLLDGNEGTHRQACVEHLGERPRMTLGFRFVLTLFCTAILL